jgi:hypothetical protein
MTALSLKSDILAADDVLDVVQVSSLALAAVDFGQ